MAIKIRRRHRTSIPVLLVAALFSSTQGNTISGSRSECPFIGEKSD
jgi:hypothetical protein